MKKFAGLMALAIALSFGTATVAPVYAGDPAPTEEKDKKQPSGPKAFENEKKDEKKDDKGGK